MTPPTLREQIKALRGQWLDREEVLDAVLAIIDQHECRWAAGYQYAKVKFSIDRDALARALQATGTDPTLRYAEWADAILAALEEQDNG